MVGYIGYTDTIEKENGKLKLNGSKATPKLLWHIFDVSPNDVNVMRCNEPFDWSIKVFRSPRHHSFGACPNIVINVL